MGLPKPREFLGNDKLKIRSTAIGVRHLSLDGKSWTLNGVRAICGALYVFDKDDPIWIVSGRLGDIKRHHNHKIHQIMANPDFNPSNDIYGLFEIGRVGRSKSNPRYILSNGNNYYDLKIVSVETLHILDKSRRQRLGPDHFALISHVLFNQKLIERMILNK